MEDRIYNSAEFQAVRRHIDMLKTIKVGTGLDALKAVEQLMELERLMQLLKPLIENEDNRKNSDPRHIMQLMIDARDVSIAIVKPLPGADKILSKLEGSRDTLINYSDDTAIHIKGEIKFAHKSINVED